MKRSIRSRSPCGIGAALMPVADVWTTMVDSYGKLVRLVAGREVRFLEPSP